jgi:hypothetical protein
MRKESEQLLRSLTRENVRIERELGRINRQRESIKDRQKPGKRRKGKLIGLSNQFRELVKQQDRILQRIEWESKDRVFDERGFTEYLNRQNINLDYRAPETIAKLRVEYASRVQGTDDVLITGRDGRARTAREELLEFTRDKSGDEAGFNAASIERASVDFTVTIRFFVSA